MATPGKTSLVRLYEGQVEKLGWLFKVRGVSSAEFIGSRIEADLNAEFEAIRPIVEQIKEAQSKPVLTHDVGGES